MSITFELQKITNESELEVVFKLNNICSLNPYVILKEVNPKLITVNLIKNLLKTGVIKLHHSDKFYIALSKRVKELNYPNGFNDPLEPIQESLEYLQDQLRIKVQDKYLTYLESDIKEMKGRSTWADTISKVMSEIAGMYELDMEKEINKIYEDEEISESEEEFTESETDEDEN
jgi:hypothetical protein